MTSGQKKELVRRWYEEILSGTVVSDGRSGYGRLSEELDLDCMFAPDYINHVSPAPPEGWKRGIDAARQIIKAYRLSFPDLTVSVQEQMAGGDLVVTRYIATGTHIAKSFFGASATGKCYSVTGLAVERIENDRIAESWGTWDTYGLMEQMGILPKTAHLHT